MLGKGRLMGKGSKRRPRDDRHCTAETFARRWGKAFGDAPKELEMERCKLPEVTYPVYSVGPDELNEYEYLPRDALWAAYYYEGGSYDGDGLLIVAFEDGTFGTNSLAHCSCYGPTESTAWEILDEGQLLAAFDFDPDRPGNEPRQPEDYDWEKWKALKRHILPLLKTGVKGIP